MAPFNRVPWLDPLRDLSVFFVRIDPITGLLDFCCILIPQGIYLEVFETQRPLEPPISSSGLLKAVLVDDE